MQQLIMRVVQYGAEEWTMTACDEWEFSIYELFVRAKTNTVLYETSFVRYMRILASFSEVKDTG